MARRASLPPTGFCAGRSSQLRLLTTYEFSSVVIGVATLRPSRLVRLDPKGAVAGLEPPKPVVAAQVAANRVRTRISGRPSSHIYRMMVG